MARLIGKYKEQNSSLAGGRKVGTFKEIEGWVSRTHGLFLKGYTHPYFLPRSCFLFDL